MNDIFPLQISCYIDRDRTFSQHVSIVYTMETETLSHLGPKLLIPNEIKASSTLKRFSFINKGVEAEKI